MLRRTRRGESLCESVLERRNRVYNGNTSRPFVFLFFLLNGERDTFVLDGGVRKNMKAVCESVSRLLLTSPPFVSISGGINGQTRGRFVCRAMLFSRANKHGPSVYALRGNCRHDVIVNAIRLLASDASRRERAIRTRFLNKSASLFHRATV